jgi:hypothetical protein
LVCFHLETPRICRWIVIYTCGCVCAAIWADLSLTLFGAVAVIAASFLGYPSINGIGVPTSKGKQRLSRDLLKDANKDRAIDMWVIVGVQFKNLQQGNEDNIHYGCLERTGKRQREVICGKGVERYRNDAITHQGN